MGVIKRQGIKNTFYNYIGIVLGVFSILYIQPLFLTTEEIGLTRSLLSIAAILGMIIPVGVTNITTRYYSYFKPSKESGETNGILAFNILFNIAGLVLISVLYVFFKPILLEKYSIHSKLLAEYFPVIIPFAFIIGLFSTITSIANSSNKSTISVLTNEIFIRVAFIIIVALYFYKILNLDFFVFSYFLIYIIAVILAVIYLYSYRLINFKFNFSFYKNLPLHEMLKYGFLMMFTAFASMGIKLIDQAMMGAFLPLSMVGIYSIGVFITAVMEAPINGIERIASAKIAEAWIEKNTEEIQKIYSDSCKYLFLLGGLLFAGLLLCTPYVFTFLPVEYEPGIQVAQIVGVASLINLATGVNSSILAYSNKYIYYSLLLFLLIILTVVCNYYFIPRYGINGAAYAMTLAGLVFNTLKTLVIYFRFHIHPFGTYTFKTILCIIAAIGVGYVLPVTGVAWTDLLIKGSGITACYLSMAYFLKIVPEMHQYIPYLNKK